MRCRRTYFLNNKAVKEALTSANINYYFRRIYQKPGITWPFTKNHKYIKRGKDLLHQSAFRALNQIQSI